MFIGRSALFRVKLTIHEITNVPLVSGRFSVAYKFRGGKGHAVTEHAERGGEGNDTYSMLDRDALRRPADETH
jgi:hypothetical protein